MNEYVLVNKNDLTSIADKVRSISGSTEPMNVLSIGANLNTQVGSIKENLTSWLSNMGESVEDGINLKDLANIVTSIKNDDEDSDVVATDVSKVNFYDYDGTLLYSYTIEEAKALKELPPLPTQSGLICQGWNWDLETIKTYDRGVDVGATYITDDGKTRIYITLQDSRTSPILGCCPNGTVTVDWGDGTEPNILIGTSTSTVKYTPNHKYATPGDYVISLTVDGEMGFYGTPSSSIYSGILRYNSGSDSRSAAYRNSVHKIEVGDGVTYMSNSSFSYCQSLVSITIPNSVTYISSNAFNGCCNLTSIIIPNSVTSIGESAFNGCYKLTSIIIPDGATSIGIRAFYNCRSLASVTIPNSVTSIGSQAFYGCCHLTSIIIPDGATSISSNTFYSCYSLASVTIPDCVTSIGDYAFYCCYSLASVTIPDGVTSIGSNAFYNCYSLASATIPDGVTSISDYAFYNCFNLVNITIPNSVISIGKYAFNCCYALASVIIPNSVTSIGSRAFYNCCSLASVTIPDGVTSISDYAFSNCQSIASLTISNSVTSIGSNAFYNIWGLANVTIPCSLTSISSGTFSNCSSMSYYDFSTHTVVPTLENTNAFGSIPADCKILVPAALYDEWIAATNWTTYASKIVPV